MRKQAVKTTDFCGKRRFVSAELDLNLILLKKDALAVCAVADSKLLSGTNRPAVDRVCR